MFLVVFLHNKYFYFNVWLCCMFLSFVYLAAQVIYIYALNLFTEHSGEHWWEQNIFCLFTTPEAFWQSSAPGPLSTLVTSVVLYSLTRSTLMSPGKDETHVCGQIYIYIYIYIYPRGYIYVNIYVDIYVDYIYIYMYPFIRFS